MFSKYIKPISSHLTFRSYLITRSCPVASLTSHEYPWKIYLLKRIRKQGIMFPWSSVPYPVQGEDK